MTARMRREKPSPVCVSVSVAKLQNVISYQFAPFSPILFSAACACIAGAIRSLTRRASNSGRHSSSTKTTLFPSFAKRACHVKLLHFTGRGRAGKPVSYSRSRRRRRDTRRISPRSLSLASIKVDTRVHQVILTPLTTSANDTL